MRLNRLARAGLIVRVKDPEDGRAVRVTLTDRGARLVDRAAETYAERASQLTAGLDVGAADVGAALTGWLEFFSPAQRSACGSGSWSHRPPSPTECVGRSVCPAPPACW